MIRFNEAPVVGTEQCYMAEAIASKRLSGDGQFTRRCEAWFSERFSCPKALLTPSCTHALEMAAILFDIGEGDEVIMPSYTFVSTANAFVLKGATIVFVDIRPDTMNIDETKIEAAITERTKAIVPVHYAGVGCDMDAIMRLADQYGLFVVEDAAQGMMSSYRGKPLGTIGHLGTFSFHETKNYTSGGEGGLLIINDKRFIERAEIIREKGTNRSLFFRGMVDKYTWVDIGSSYLMNDLSAAYLWGQLEAAETINDDRLRTWQRYYDALAPLAAAHEFELPHVPEICVHNAHMFYIKVKDLEQRSALLDTFEKQQINAVFHYVPLHTSTAGKRYGRFDGDDRYTTSESDRLVRLPLYFGISEEAVDIVVDVIREFFH